MKIGYIKRPRAQMLSGVFLYVADDYSIVTLPFSKFTVNLQ